jgi:hypothetical protein
MRKFNRSSFNSLVLLSVLGASLVATNVHAESRHHRAESVYQEFRPFAENAPKFSGFYANLGLAYNSIPGMGYTDTFTPTGTMASDVNATASSSSFISGLIKIGYAYRFGQTGYLGVAGFYNLSATQKTLNATYQYAGVATNPVQISNTVQQSPGYGIMLQPGFLVSPYSLVYANVGAQMTSLKFESQQTNVSGDAAANAVSTNKTAMNYIIGVGYQRQMSFIKSSAARNLMWFTELNYGLGKTSVSQSITPPGGAQPLQPGRSETYSATPGGLQAVVGISYYF